MTALEFLELVRRSQLVDAEALHQLLKLPNDGDAIAVLMIQAGLLTEWQADKLLAGKFKGFLLGDYTILDHHEKTAVSQNYLAEHTQEKHKVVLAVAPPNGAADAAFAKHFREAIATGLERWHGSVRFVVLPYDDAV
jgi:serine/threonine-protein kinase